MPHLEHVIAKLPAGFDSVRGGEAGDGLLAGVGAGLDVAAGGGVVDLAGALPKSFSQKLILFPFCVVVAGLVMTPNVQQNI